MRWSRWDRGGEIRRRNDKAKDDFKDKVNAAF